MNEQWYLWFIKTMNMGRGFNKETLSLNMSQQWASDAALKTVKVKVVLKVLSAIIQLVCKLWSRMCDKRRALGLLPLS